MIELWKAVGRSATARRTLPMRSSSVARDARDARDADAADAGRGCLVCW
jgi:hypothetical protein